MKRAAQVRELKNKIERQKPAKSIKKDHHHSAIHEVCKKKTQRKTHWFSVETKEDN